MLLLSIYLFLSFSTTLVSADSCSPDELRTCMNQVQYSMESCPDSNNVCLCSSMKTVADICYRDCPENMVVDYLVTYADSSCRASGDKAPSDKTLGDDLSTMEFVRFNGDSSFQHRDDNIPFPFPGDTGDINHLFDEHADDDEDNMRRARRRDPPLYVGSSIANIPSFDRARGGSYETSLKKPTNVNQALPSGSYNELLQEKPKEDYNAGRYINYGEGTTTQRPTQRASASFDRYTFLDTAPKHKGETYKQPIKAPSDAPRMDTGYRFSGHNDDSRYDKEYSNSDQYMYYSPSNHLKSDRDAVVKSPDDDYDYDYEYDSNYDEEDDNYEDEEEDKESTRGTRILDGIRKTVGKLTGGSISVAGIDDDVAGYDSDDDYDYPYDYNEYYTQDEEPDDEDSEDESTEDFSEYSSDDCDDDGDTSTDNPSFEGYESIDSNEPTNSYDGQVDGSAPDIGNHHTDSYSQGYESINIRLPPPLRRIFEDDDNDDGDEEDAQGSTSDRKEETDGSADESRQSEKSDDEADNFEEVIAITTVISTSTIVSVSTITPIVTVTHLPVNLKLTDSEPAEATGVGIYPTGNYVLSTATATVAVSEATDSTREYEVPEPTPTEDMETMRQRLQEEAELKSMKSMLSSQRHAKAEESARMEALKSKAAQGLNQSQDQNQNQQENNDPLFDDHQKEETNRVKGKYLRLKSKSSTASPMFVLCRHFGIIIGVVIFDLMF